MKGGPREDPSVLGILGPSRNIPLQETLKQQALEHTTPGDSTLKAAANLGHQHSPLPGLSRTLQGAAPSSSPYQLCWEVFPEVSPPSILRQLGHI